MKKGSGDCKKAKIIFINLAYHNLLQLIASLISPVHNTTHTYYGDRDILQTTLNIWKNKPDNAMISRYIYNVNNLGQRTAVATAGEAFDTASPADWQWSYDVLGQVKSANRDTAVAGNTAENYQYAYDQIGNRVTTRKGTAPDTIYTANALNQYATIGTSVTPTYDADGNQLNGLMPTAELSERGQLIFSYNAENRPLSVSKNGVLQEAYSHDHMGRRIQEGNTITIYDGYNAIAEYTVNGVLKTSYAWGLDLSNTLQGAGGVGGLLSQTDYTGQLPLISYPTYDGNGNVTEYVTEANNGTIATHYEYDAFGNVINTNNPNNTPTGKQYRYQFSTKPYNRLTGLNYYNYRDYDPVSGRWISPDPIEEQGGLNLYGGIDNDFLNKIDILGLLLQKLSQSDIIVRDFINDKTLTDAQKKVVEEKDANAITKFEAVENIGTCEGCKIKIYDDKPVLLIYYYKPMKLGNGKDKQGNTLYQHEQVHASLWIDGWNLIVSQVNVYDKKEYDSAADCESALEGIKSAYDASIRSIEAAHRKFDADTRW